MKLGKYGILKQGKREEQLFGPINEYQNILMGYLAQLAMHPKVLKHFLSLKPGKTYWNYKWIKQNNGEYKQTKPKFEQIYYQGPIDFYTNGEYEINKVCGKLLQDILRYYSD